MGQSQKSECAVPSIGPLMGLRFPARNQRRLRWRHAQTKTGKPCRQHCHELTGVRFQFAPHDEVIGKAHEKAAPLHAWLYVPLEPCIQDMMEKEMRSYG
jgi:hypothetical protein